MSWLRSYRVGFLRRWGRPSMPSLWNVSILSGLLSRFDLLRTYVHRWLPRSPSARRPPLPSTTLLMLPGLTTVPSLTWTPAPRGEGLALAAAPGWLGLPPPPPPPPEEEDAVWATSTCSTSRCVWVSNKLGISLSTCGIVCLFCLLMLCADTQLFCWHSIPLFVLLLETQGCC